MKHRALVWNLIILKDLHTYTERILIESLCCRNMLHVFATWEIIAVYAFRRFIFAVRINLYICMYIHLFAQPQRFILLRIYLFHMKWFTSWEKSAIYRCKTFVWKVLDNVLWFIAFYTSQCIKFCVSCIILSSNACNTCNVSRFSQEHLPPCSEGYM